MRRYLIIALSLWSICLSAQVKVTKEVGANKDCFPLLSDNKSCLISHDDSDFEVVKITASLFADDLERVTGVRGRLTTNAVSGNVVLVGTIGHNKQIDELIKQGKLDVNTIKGSWERYVIKTIDSPFKGVDKALVIAGSDRRGTAYGILSLSEAIGVSPWYWWADVPAKKKANALYVAPLNYISKAPSVKYRGIFLNDEGWGLFPWASKTDDPALGDIGPKTYAKICELLLRSKGNMLCPAMHPGSGAFNTHEENKLVADRYAIMMGSSHCEPLLFNNTTEWHKETMGEWNYIQNKEGINRVLEKRVSENAPYENIYTIAMRGIHDAGIVGVPEEKKVEMMTDVMADQRAILSKFMKRPADSIPQIFVPYKEVLDIYERGLEVPDDITLVWPDDNYGYIKRLSNKEERKRSGGSGVYYHLSYIGEPHDYIWLNTTPPALMYEEMRKAYDLGADRYWLLNVGDIKPGEQGMRLFLDMAWNIDGFNYGNINEYNTDWLTSIYGLEYRNTLEDIMSSYYQLAFHRKPEAMGWGIEWNNYHHNERVTDTDFSFVNYNEAENRMKEYDRISQKAEAIYRSLPEEHKPSFFQLVYYPVKGSALMNKKMLTAQQNHWYAQQNRAATNLLAKKAQLYSDSIDLITKEYNSLLNGKWNHMMTVPSGWTATYQNMPAVETIELSAKADMGIFLSGEDCEYGVRNTNVLPCFNPYTKKDYFVEIYNKGTQALAWKASTRDGWIKLNQTKGNTTTQNRVTVSVDWSKAPVGNDIKGEIEIVGAGKKEKVYVSLFNPQTPAVEELKGLYVEDNGCISINGGDFHRKTESKDVKIEVINGLGYENQCVQLGHALDPVQETWFPKGPKVEYDFYAFNAGRAVVYTYALPLFAVDKEHDTRYGIMLDDGWIHRPSTASREYSGAWLANVIRNSTVNVSYMNIDQPGKHTLQILCIDPGMIIQKIVIDMGGMKRSYLGPDVMKVK